MTRTIELCPRCGDPIDRDGEFEQIPGMAPGAPGAHQHHIQKCLDVVTAALKKERERSAELHDKLIEALKAHG